MLCLAAYHPCMSTYFWPHNVRNPAAIRWQHTPEKGLTGKLNITVWLLWLHVLRSSSYVNFAMQEQTFICTAHAAVTELQRKRCSRKQCGMRKVKKYTEIQLLLNTFGVSLHPITSFVFCCDETTGIKFGWGSQSSITGIMSAFFLPFLSFSSLCCVNI